MQNTLYRAFTNEHTTRANTLTTTVGVCKAKRELNNDTKQYNALWDTGATNSVITINIINDFNLQPIDSTYVSHVGGITKSDIYLIDIFLPNRVVISSVPVTYMETTEDPNNPIDVLIGMDIISLGDFAITNSNFRTTMSFMIPSHEKIDFVLLSENLNMQKFGN